MPSNWNPGSGWSVENSRKGPLFQQAFQDAGLQVLTYQQPPFFQKRDGIPAGSQVDQVQERLLRLSQENRSVAAHKGRTVSEE